MKKTVLYLCGAMVMISAMSFITGALAPYIPSYDDWYDVDLAKAKQNKNCFVEPADELNYAKYHYVGAHDAEKYPRFFPQYAKQNQPIPSLLYLGTRGLMISTYDWFLSWSNIIREGISVVCSSPTIESKVRRKNPKKLLYQTLHYEMNRIFNFLKEHPQAIITIFFDDYSTPAKLLRDIKEIVMKNDYDPILRPSDWPAAQQKNEWPTLGWMRKNNKRLVLFTQTDDKHSASTWPVKWYFWENIYGSVDENVICAEEKESLVEDRQKNRSLVSFACYGSGYSYSPASRDIKSCVSYDTAKKLTTGCQKRGFARGKMFNVYWADRVIEGINGLRRDGSKTVFDYANELNAGEITKK